MAKSSARQSKVERQIKRLQMRVTVLERAFKAKPRRRANNQVWEDYERRSAEIDARSNAMREYYDKERQQRLRDDPIALRIAIEQEHKQNAFLESKGMEPNASMIPQALRRKAKSLEKGNR